MALRSIDLKRYFENIIENKVVVKDRFSSVSERIRCVSVQ